MKTILAFLLLTAMSLTSSVKANTAASVWPKIIKSSQAKITIYQPQPLSFSNNRMECMAAVSILENNSPDPIFGSFWAEATMGTNRDRRSVTLESLEITKAKFPGLTDETRVRRYQSLIETEAPRWNLVMSLDELLATLEDNQKQQNLSDQLAIDPPTIIFKNVYSVLVQIDGEPIWENDSQTGFDRVVNTPFNILRNRNGQLYLYGGGYWYNASSVEGPWSPLAIIPSTLKSIDKSIKQSEKENKIEKSPAPAQIVISFEPAELIQSDGKADFAPIEGTGLLYMTNSNDEIFMHIDSQKYYLLISGRWYRTGTLSGPWQYVAADQLPEDFASIPSDSERGTVLANVAGTEEAREAVLDAQIPQTAKVYRNNANTDVYYDGDPLFEPINGTALSYAVNTSSPVIRAEGLYYVVDNGVWFISNRPNGPWTVATMRPQAVMNIPPSYPVYNIKYVYIYDVTPEYVYMGYTPGYLGTYIYGPVVVYGTGYHYRPWHGRHYYARPRTWGFNMHYNPWTGWSLGIDYSFGWFHFDTWKSNSWRPGWGGGWWGPVVYRPPYHVHHDRYVSRYREEPRNRYNGPNNHYSNINRNYTNNIYNHRKDVETHDVARKPALDVSRTSTRSSSNAVTRPSTRQVQSGGSTQGSSGSVSRGNRPTGTATQSSGRTVTRQSTSTPTRSSGTYQRPASRPSDTSTRPTTTTRSSGSVTKRSEPTRESSAPAGESVTPRPTTRSTQTTRNNVTVDREGNVYKQNSEGNVQQYNGQNWNNVQNNRNTEQRVNRQIEQRERGSVNTTVKSQSTERGGNVGESYTKRSATPTRQAAQPATRSAEPNRQSTAPATRSARSSDPEQKAKPAESKQEKTGRRTR